MASHVALSNIRAWPKTFAVIPMKPDGATHAVSAIQPTSLTEGLRWRRAGTSPSPSPKSNQCRYESMCALRSTRSPTPRGLRYRVEHAFRPALPTFGLAVLAVPDAVVFELALCTSRRFRRNRFVRQLVVLGLDARKARGRSRSDCGRCCRVCGGTPPVAWVLIQRPESANR